MMYKISPDCYNKVAMDKALRRRRRHLAVGLTNEHRTGDVMETANRPL